MPLGNLMTRKTGVSRMSVLALGCSTNQILEVVVVRIYVFDLRVEDGKGKASTGNGI